MKLAYVAFDKTALKTHPALEQYFSAIDTYLVNPQSEASDLDILNLAIMADHVFIPSDVTLQTLQHKLVLQKIKNEYLFLKQNIFSGFSFQGEELIGARTAEKQQFDLSEVLSITFDKNRKKHIIQTEGQNFIDYDYLIIEGHQLVSGALAKKNQNIISKTQIQSSLVLNLEFSMQYKLHKQHLHHEFIFIANTELRTLFDNWYLCSLSHNKIGVSLYIPYEQHWQAEFLDFMTQRTHKLISLTFESFAIGELIKRGVSTSDGFVTRNLKLNHTKTSAAFPSFAYWPQNKINDYIKNVFVNKNVIGQLQKNKKNLYLFAEKESP